MAGVDTYGDNSNRKGDPRAVNQACPNIAGPRHPSPECALRLGGLVFSLSNWWKKGPSWPPWAQEWP